MVQIVKTTFNQPCLLFWLSTGESYKTNTARAILRPKCVQSLNRFARMRICIPRMRNSELERLRQAEIIGTGSLSLLVRTERFM